MKREQFTDEIRPFRRCINDLVSILALPAIWTGSEESDVIHVLLRTLLRMLDLDFMYARLSDTRLRGDNEFVEISESLRSQLTFPELLEMIRSLPENDLPNWPRTLGGSGLKESFSIVPLPLGLRREFGIIVAGSQRPDFPEQTERLVLDVAANQTLIGLQEAKLLREQKRVAEELDRRVAQRTAELANVNKQLASEVAERKRVEEALDETELESRLIVESIPGLVALLSKTGEVEVVNRQMTEYFRRTLDELKSWGTNDTIHPDELQQVVIKFTRSIEEGRPYEIVQRLRRGDGVYRWVENRGFPLRYPNGEIRRWCVLLTDIDERKRAEDALRESEQQFKAIFDEAGTGITLVDLIAGEPIRNNRALQKMLSCTEEELSRFETYERLTYAANRERDAITFRELCEGKRDSLNIEKHFVLRNGESIWANVIFTLLRDDERRPRYIIAIHEDITERKLALERLQSNQDLLDLAQKSAGAMAFDWYIQEEVNYWSPEQEALFGLVPGAFDGTYKTWKKMMYAPDWPVVVDAIRHAHQTGEVTAEYRVVWPDGSLHWLSTNGRMFFDEAGEPLRMVGFTSDVTRRKQAEEELRRNEALLAEGQQLARMGNFSWRVATDEIIWSDQLYRIYDFEPGVLLTFDLLAERLHPDDIVLLREMIRHARQGKSNLEYEHRVLMADHSVKYLHLIAHRTQDENGPIEYIGAVQDVTQRHLSEEALNQARSELARTARAMSLGVLTASIAHEVNQPLSGIITNANTGLRMLNADPPNIAGARKTVERTIRDGNRASEVISRLRSLFGKKEFTVEPIDLNEATKEVVALSRNELQRNNIVIQTEFAGDLPPVEGDRVQLQQVILNLLLNASEAMNGVNDRPRQLTIATEMGEADGVRLSVRDVGFGVASDAQERLFDAFYTTKKDGMGIGLSVSRSIIERHRGRLWAEPNGEHGAVFTFSLPVLGTLGVAPANSANNNQFARLA